MSSLQEIRSKYPEYGFMSDDELAGAIHKKFYADVPRDEFDRRVGLTPSEGAGRFAAPALAAARPSQNKAREQVMKMRQEAPVMTAIDDKVRQFARGTPIGSWLDEANALTASYLPQALGGMPYEEALALQRARDEVADEDSTVVGKLPVIGDVTVGGLTKLAGGLASAPVSPMARVVQGNAILPSAVNAGVTGVGYGAIYGAGEGDGSDRATNAAMGAAMGGTIGLAAPIVASGVSNAVGAATRRAAPVPQQLSGFDRSAVDRLSRASGPIDAAAARALGREGMVADASGALQDVTEAIAQQPGPQRQIVQGALNARAEGAPQRIRSALNSALGPAVDLQATERAIRQNYNQQAAPFYRQFYATRLPPDPQLDAILDRVPQEFWGRVERLMRLEGVDPRLARSTGHGLDLIKRALDDAARAAGRGTNEERLVSDVARQLRSHVDNLLSPGDPTLSPWAQARAIAGEGIGGREALEMGSRVFSGKMDPVQLRAEMQGMSTMEQDMLRAGARTDLRGMMGRAATNFGPNGDAVARRALNSEFSRDNVREIADPQASARLLQTIDNESTFAETRNQALSNSATARRQATRDIIPRQYDQSNAANLRGTSLSGAVAEGVARIANILTAGALNERNARIATDMARMLVARGAARDDVIAGLNAYVRQTGLNNQQRANIRRVVRDLIRGTSQPAIEAVTVE